MESDELNAPLGQAKAINKWLPQLSAAAPQVLAGLLTLGGLMVIGWAAFVNDPLGGEPIVVIATKTPGAAQPAATGDGKEHARRDGIQSQAPADKAKTDAPPPGSKTVTIIDGSSGESKKVLIPGQPEAAAGGRADGSSMDKPDDQKLLEKSRHGAIPKIGADGTRPSTVYARPRTLPASRKEAPRIAVIVGGLGISASGTANAFSLLPETVSFAITPYGNDIGKLAEHARTENHEVLLQVPMEPFDYPDNDPGPQTLLTSLTSEQNVDRLHWLMSRFQGYVGVASFMGARFNATEQALSPVLQDIAKRGLIFVDGSASARSVAGQISGSQSLPFAKTDVILDTVPTPLEIDRALARLEIIARGGGVAVGLATAQPVTVARIAEWAKSVESRGFVLVPISMIALKAKSS